MLNIKAKIKLIKNKIKDFNQYYNWNKNFFISLKNRLNNSSWTNYENVIKNEVDNLFLYNEKLNKNYKNIILFFIKFDIILKEADNFTLILDELPKEINFKLIKNYDKIKLNYLYFENLKWFFDKEWKIFKTKNKLINHLTNPYNLNIEPITTKPSFKENYEKLIIKNLKTNKLENRISPIVDFKNNKINFEIINTSKNLIFNKLFIDEKRKRKKIYDLIVNKNVNDDYLNIINESKNFLSNIK